MNKKSEESWRITFNDDSISEFQGDLLFILEDLSTYLQLGLIKKAEKVEEKK